MYFEVLQSLSLNGALNKPNDDRMGATARSAWVVDGATDLGAHGLMGAQGGASWLSSTASRGFALSDKTTVQDSCTFVFDYIASRFATERTRSQFEAWEMPKAAFCAAQIVEGALEVAWSADCTILRHSMGHAHWCTDAPDSTSEVAAARALAQGADQGVGSGPALVGEALADRRAQRAQPDHQALSADAEASAMATGYARSSIQIGDELLIMSDGFSALISDYAAYEAGALMQAVQRNGLLPLAQELREIEDADRKCLRYPRFKVSDDATVQWLRVCG